MEAAISACAAVLGIDDKTVRFMASLFLSVLLSAPAPYLPNAALRHAWLGLTGMAAAFFVFERDALHMVAAAAIVYLLLACTERISALKHWRHWIAAITAFAYLTYRQLQREAANVSIIDDSILQMVLVVKMYALAYNLYDGTAQKARIAAAIADDKTSDKAKKIYIDRRDRSIGALPSLLEYFGYTFNLATIFAGPAMEITEYKRATGRPTAAYTALARSQLRACLHSAAIGLVCIITFATVRPVFPLDGIYTQAAEALGTPVEGATHSFGVFDSLPVPALLKRILWAHVALTLIRVQYYGVWKIADAASIIGGFGLVEGKTASSEASSETRWDGITNVRPLAVEGASSFSAVLRHWNINTQGWLERHIFLRAPRSVSRWVTFFASAFWHGFFSGYYLGFLTLPLFQECARIIYSSLRPVVTGGTGISNRSTIAYKAYVVLRQIALWLLLDYALGAFALLEWHKSIVWWQSFFFAGHIAPVLAALLALSIGTIMHPRRKSKDN